MSKNEQQIRAKMNSIWNYYGSDENFVAHMDKWPRTVRELIFSSTELMIHFKLVELLPDPKETFIGME